MRIGRHILRPRAFIFIAIILLSILGVYISVQEKTESRTVNAVRSEGKRYEIPRQVSPGPRNSNRTIRPIQETFPRIQGAMWAAYNGKLSEYGDNAKIEETDGYSVPACRGSDRLYTSVFDTSGTTFKITAYTAGYESTGKRPGDKGYGITFGGKKVQGNHTIAADLTILPLGTKILIEGIDTVFTVEDKGSAVKGKHVDVYMPVLKEALEWGVQYRRIVILDRGLENGGK